jgi:hypothetical protein
VVLAGLLAERPERLDLSPLLWRLRERPFFDQAIALLERRRIYDRAVWSYAVFHDAAGAIAEFLAHEGPFLARVGTSIDSPLLRFDAIADRRFLHLDFAPLTHARCHPFGDRSVLDGTGIGDHYRRLLDDLCLRSAWGSDQQLELAYHLMLQDRVEDACAAFARIDAKETTAKLQYDYFRAWLAMRQSDTATARTIAAAHADALVQSWRLRFAELSAQLDEIASVPVRRDPALADQQRQQLQAARTPSLHAELVDGAISVTYANMTQCEARYHPMDLEMLFSRAPFDVVGGDRATRVLPTAVATTKLDPARQTVRIPVPEPFRRTNALIEIEGGGQRQILASYASALDLRLAPASGQLQVVRTGDGKPIPAAYVKVYAELADGRVAFHKDGYTDLRGRFDYVTLSGGGPAGMRRLALFVHGDADGSAVREVTPPTR